MADLSLRKTLEDWQIRWAERNGIRIGAPPGNPASRATGYVSQLQDNLFDPLSERVKQQFIAGAGGELVGPDGQSGNMYAVYSSSALCVNLFHWWFRLLDAAPPNSKPSVHSLLTACGLPARPAKSIDFEVPNIVNRNFKVAPHLDVQISFDGGCWKCAGIEAKFCEPYGGQKRGGLNPVYLRETALWQDWPNVRAFAQEVSPEDLTHSHFHAAQLIKHLLGLRKQSSTSFVLVYLWFDVPSAEAATRHRREIDFFGEVLKRDGVAFVSRTYQEVFEVLRGGNGEHNSSYLAYLLDRYLDDAPPHPGTHGPRARRREGQGREIRAQADSHRAPAARSTGAGCSGRDTAQHRAQLQRQSGDDFTIASEGRMAAMKPRLDDYLAPIGKLTIATALLEEVVIRWAALLSEGDHSETHAKRLRRGLETNLKFLIERVKERVSPASQQSVLDLIEDARKLKDKRNENVHAVWSDMVEIDTGAFSHVARSRYDKDASGNLVWQPHITPTISELNQFADDLDKKARELNERLADLWDIDPQVQAWRVKHGF